MTIYSALPFVRRTGMYSIRLPNLYNVSFDYYYCLIVIMLSYIPCKIYFNVQTYKATVTSMFFCFIPASVSSALLPHAAAEEKGASRGGHRGEGRLGRPPPLASRHHHLPHLILGAIVPRRTRAAVPSEWKHAHSSLQRSLRQKLVVMRYLFSPVSLHLFTSGKQLVTSPELTPVDKIGSFLW